jgi:hypothetical protein
MRQESGARIKKSGARSATGERVKSNSGSEKALEFAELLQSQA